MKDTDVRTGRSVISEPRVSIIMPTYNVASYISAAIESVLSQSFRSFEIIVVNDGSPDTPELEESLLPYFDHIIYAKQQHRGVASARNTALRLARAPIIAQLDPDDEWLPNFLSTLLEIMDLEPTLDLVYSNSIIFGGSVYDGMEKMQLSPSYGDVTFERVVSEECTVLSSLVGKKESFLRVGGFDESLHASEDFDMWLRILKSGGQIGYERVVLARNRRRKDSLSADDVMMSNSILQVLSKAEQTLSLTAREQKCIAESKLKWEAFIHLSEGKQAILNRSVDVAVERFTAANKYYRKRKISFLIWFLQVAPRAALNTRMFRELFEYR